MISSSIDVIPANEAVIAKDRCGGSAHPTASRDVYNGIMDAIWEALRISSGIGSNPCPFSRIVRGPSICHSRRPCAFV
jgi:hypothetical protein